MIEHSFRLQPRRRRHNSALPDKYQPMLLSTAVAPFARAGWIFEPKLDGMRGIALVEEGTCRIFSRNGLDFTKAYPELAEDLAARQRRLVLDGEIVCLDDLGKPNFELLQQRIRLQNAGDVQRARRTNPAYFYLFDVLSLDGEDCMTRPLRERKRLLSEVCESQAVKQVSWFETDGQTVFTACRKNGLEGIVGKDGASRYAAGKRSASWVKVKVLQTTDVVIGGYKPDIGFLVGRFDDSGDLLYCGSVLGGLSKGEHDFLRQNLIERQTCPFAAPIERWKACWFEPTVVAEVRFMLWTSGGFLRMPAFNRLRPELRAGDLSLPT